MILSEKAIRRSIEAGDIRIDPFEPGNLKPGSYTFTLDERIRKMRGESAFDERISLPEWEDLVMGADGYVLKPGEFVIVYTKENIEIGPEVMCILGTRSKNAQAGLDFLQTSTIAEPGHIGSFALETTNVSGRPIVIYPGMKAVKGVFFQVTD